MWNLFRLLGVNTIRNSAHWWHVAGFFVLCLLLLPLTSAGRIDLYTALSFILLAVWLATLMSGSDFFASEFTCGALELWMRGECHPLLLILIKVLHHWFASVIVLMPLLWLGGIFYTLSLNVVGMLMLVVAIGLLPTAFLLAFGDALLLNAKRSGLLLPVLVLPLLMTTILFAARTLLAYIAVGVTSDNFWFPFSLLLLQAAAHILFMPWCIVFALRASIRYA